MKRYKSVVLSVAVCISGLCLAGSATASVIQIATAVQGTTPLINNPGSSTIDATLHASDFSRFDEQRIFGVTSADINNDILAEVQGRTIYGPYDAVSAAGRFGSVGLSTNILQEASSGMFTGARVLIASDEFANITGIPQSVAANFIIDGGALNITFGRNVRAGYRLVIGATNLGNVPMTTSEDELLSLLFFGDDPLFYDVTFGSAGSLQSDSNGNTQYITYPVDLATVNSDIGAVFDPGRDQVNIPLSFQSFDLGTLQPGDRLLLFYSLYLETSLTGGGASFAKFSDPLQLGDMKFPTVTFHPVNAAPEPSTLALLTPLVLWWGIAGLRVRKRFSN